MKQTRAQAARQAGSWTLDWQTANDGVLVAVLGGNWRLADSLPDAGEADSTLAGKHSLLVDGSALEAWDSGLLAYLSKLAGLCAQRSIAFDTKGMPEGARRLLGLATAVPERAGARRSVDRDSFLTAVGRESLKGISSAGQLVSFLTDSARAASGMFRGRPGFRYRDLLALMQACGAQALPIVTLISLLVGMILAFVGAVQLTAFGAQVFVADLVSLAMAREMAGMMTGIVMAGRTGAAFAAQLGTMQVNQEIDAFKTFGIDPMRFLVLPRMIALIVMVPMLTIYANLVGMLGGALVGVGVMGIGPLEYLDRTQSSVGLGDFAGGLFKAAIFGVLIAVAGCMRGMNCGRSAQAVGDAATSAVVTGIIFIIVSDTALTVVYMLLGV